MSAYHTKECCTYEVIVAQRGVNHLLLLFNRKLAKARADEEEKRWRWGRGPAGRREALSVKEAGASLA